MDNDTVVVDLATAPPGLPVDMAAFIAAGPSVLPKAMQAVSEAGTSARLPVKEA